MNAQNDPTPQYALGCVYSPEVRAQGRRLDWTPAGLKRLATIAVPVFRAG